jgi:glutathione S-transferase
LKPTLAATASGLRARVQIETQGAQTTMTAQTPPPPTSPRLYTFRRCPYAIRARMALLQAGRSFEAVEVSLRDKPASLLALSPKATVPVLHLPDGRVIEESWDIVRWALAEPDRQGWWARAQSPANLDLLQRNDGDFKRHLDRWKYPQRYPGADMTPQDHRDAATNVLLHPLEARLGHAPYLGGITACATDLAVMPFVRQYAAVAPGWFAAQSLPAVQAWLRSWLDHPLFVTCMQKLPGTGSPTASEPIGANAFGQTQP